MNYIVQINRFWLLNSEYCFQPSDAMLYFYLLDTCNKLGWKNPFGHSDRHLSANIGVSVNTIRASKIRLVKAGLITVSTPLKPSRSFKGQTLYHLTTVSNSDTDQTTVSINHTDSDTVIDTVPDTVPDTNIKQNKKETKKIISIPEKINRDFSVFEQVLKRKFPNVSKLEEQMTLTEYITLLQEFKISNETLFDILERMENYKPLKKNNRSVYYTIRAWFKKDLKQNNNISTSHYSNIADMNLIQRKVNEGPTL